jgi:hypothetical protein
MGSPNHDWGKDYDPFDLDRNQRNMSQSDNGDQELNLPQYLPNGPDVMIDPNLGTQIYNLQHVAYCQDGQGKSP